MYICTGFGYFKKFKCDFDILMPRLNVGNPGISKRIIRDESKICKQLLVLFRLHRLSVVYALH